MPGTEDHWGAFVEQATDSAQAGSPGPLSGLRLAVKDNIAVAGLKWTAGIPLLSERRAREDAPCVGALRAAGAAVVGVTATDSGGFGMTTPGVVNPRAPDRTAGGSSGGSTAAVAGGLADLALGTDTAGSVRVPAACCGVYGFKPTFGRVSTEGVTPLAASFDHVGLIAGELGPIERAAAVLLGERPGSRPRRRLVIGHDPGRLEGDESGAAAVIALLLERLASEGHRVRDVRLPDRDALVGAHGVITCREAFQVWAPHWPQEAERLGDTARRTLTWAATLGDEQVEAAWQTVRRLRADIAAAFAEVDLIVGATLRTPPPKAGARRVRVAGEELAVVHALLTETCSFNVSGHAALAMPVPTGPGLPVSIQIAGKDDMALLAMAQVVEAALK